MVAERVTGRVRNGFGWFVSAFKNQEIGDVSLSPLMGKTSRPLDG